MLRGCRLIQVLWIENDPKVISDYPGEAEDNYDLQLVPFTNWEEGKCALLAEYDRWDAIILDAKCCLTPNATENARTFLTEVISELVDIYHDKGRTINWYVLSGDAEGPFYESIPKSCMKWDEDWIKDSKKRYYAKATDRDILYRRIKKHHFQRKEIVLRNDLYKEVFEASCELGLDSQIEQSLIDMLVPIHFGGVSDRDYNRLFAELRKSVENVFRSMYENGIIPGSLMKSGHNNELNLSWISLFLSGKPKKESNVIAITKVFPEIIASVVKNIIFDTGAALHTSTAKPEERRNVDNYLPLVGYSSNLLRSHALAFADVILWYRHYMQEHPDIERNRLDWKEI